MKYRKKPVVIDAEQWQGTKKSLDKVMAMGDIPWRPGEMGTETFLIETLEGDHLVRKGDFVIKGVAGEFYPCKPGIFEKTYEPADCSKCGGKGFIFDGACGMKDCDCVL